MGSQQTHPSPLSQHGAALEGMLKYMPAAGHFLFCQSHAVAFSTLLWDTYGNLTQNIPRL